MALAVGRLLSFRELHFHDHCDVFVAASLISWSISLRRVNASTSPEGLDSSFFAP